MTVQRPPLLLLLAFVGSILAGVVPIGLSVRELATLHASVQEINDLASVARQARDVAESIGLAVMDFTAVALDIEPAERTSILAETDKHVSQFTRSVVRLKQAIKHWLSEQQDKDLTEATEELAHSWEEIRDQAKAEMSSQEKVHHFLQIADNAKKARAVLLAVEAHTSSLAETQTRLAFDRLAVTGMLLLAAMLVGFTTGSFGSFKIFRSLEST